MTNWGGDQLTAPGGCWQKSSEHITAQLDPKLIACNLLLEHSSTFSGLPSASVPSPKSLGFRCVQNGSSARRKEGAYLDRYVTDEQRSSRPIFNATLRAAASWLFFRVARSTGMIQIAALRSRLEKQPTDLRRSSRDLGDGTLAALARKSHERFGWSVFRAVNISSKNFRKAAGSETLKRA